MKQTLLALVVLAFSFTSKAQIFQGSANVNSGNLSVSVDINSNTNQVTLQLTGPNNGGYYAFGFGGGSMAGTYAIIVDGSGNVQERQLGNHTAGSVLSSSVSVVSNVVSGSSRTITLTRSRMGATGSHFTFPASSTSFSIIWARGTNASLSYHGSTRGASIISLSSPCNIPTTTLPLLTFCEGDSLQIFGAWRTASGTYDTTYTAQNGCDSVVEQPVFRNSVGVRNLQPAIHICHDGSTFLFGNVVTEAGTYYDTLQASTGCDSILAQEVIEDSLNVSWTSDASTITLNVYPDTAFVRWFDCVTGLEVATGDTSFTATANNPYQAVVYNGVCVDSTPCINLQAFSIADNALGSATIQPNPIRDLLRVENLTGEVQWRVVNTLGMTIAEGQTNESSLRVESSNWSSGVYILELSRNNAVRTIRFVKP